MARRLLKRREFLKLSAVATVAAVAAACGTPKEGEKPTQAPTQATEVPTVTQPTPQAPAVVPEPPALADQVAAGKLPPLKDRLPVNPFIVKREAVGAYGDELRVYHNDPVWSVSTYDLFSDLVLKYSDEDLRTIVPHAVESWEASEDGKTFTLHMRQGMKWSDGEPLTTQDVDFWWNGFANKEGLGWVGGAFAGIGAKYPKVEIVDDYTFKVIFDYPFGIFPAALTRNVAGSIDGPFFPKHYFTQFHADYTDEATLKAKIDELKLETWEQVFNHYAGWGMNVWQFPSFGKDHPTLSAWIPVEYPAEGLILCKRNPYYWKVDQAGNQLPYIDGLRLDLATNVEALNMKIIQGELDYVGPEDVSIARYTLYKENEQGGKYKVGDYLSCLSDRYVIFPRFTLPEDPVLEKIVSHPNWVKALSVAIDRDEINESLFLGLAKMGQLAPMPNSSYYKEEYGTAWAQYDTKLANQLLDEMGLDKKDSEGFRLRPDGKRLAYNVEHSGIRVGVSVAEFTEMIVTFWREIGIEATVKEIAENLLSERMRNNQVQCTLWHADRCTDMLLPLEMHWFIPVGGGQQGGASAAWAAWYTARDRTAEGLIEPPANIKQLYEWHDKMREVVSETERVAWAQKILDELAKNPLAIGSVLESPCPLIFNQSLRNLPRPKVPVGWDTWDISMYHPEAFFFEGGKRA